MVIRHPIPPRRPLVCRAEFGAKIFPLTAGLHEQAVSLPASPVIADDEVAAVVKAVNSYP